MGSSSSAALEAALQSPLGPMRALTSSWITQSPTSLHLKVSLSGLNTTVTDVSTNEVVYTFSSQMLSSRTHLKDQTGEILVTIKEKTFSSKVRVFQGDQTEVEHFKVWNIGGILSTMLFVTEFYDLKTGAPCRVVAEGNAGKRASLCYLERGDPTLSKLQKSDDFATNKGKYQPIGRFSNIQKLFGCDEYDIEAPAGVDLTLLLVLLHVRHLHLQAERTATY